MLATTWHKIFANHLLLGPPDVLEELGKLTSGQSSLVVDIIIQNCQPDPTMSQSI